MKTFRARLSDLEGLVDLFDAYRIFYKQTPVKDGARRYLEEQYKGPSLKEYLHLRDGPSSSSTNNASDPRTPASVPATSCPTAFHTGLKLHVLVEEEGVSALAGMGVDFVSKLFEKHLVACACGSVSFITQVMGLACGID